MKIGVFARKSVKKEKKNVEHLVRTLTDVCCFKVSIYEELKSIIATEGVKKKENISYFSDRIFSDGEIDYLLVIGGDGTMLDSIRFVLGTNIPLMGINFGRLGFLTGVGKEEVSEIHKILTSDTLEVEQRDTISIRSKSLNNNMPLYALNDLYITKKTTNTLIETEVYIDDNFLNAYHSDGLIISTPTGSTGYSLSCGGPIMHYRSSDLLITPISPHDLNVRPIVVPGNSQIKIYVREGRVKKVNVSYDAKVHVVSGECVFFVQKSQKKVSICQKKGESYYEKIKRKLYWGIQ